MIVYHFSTLLEGGAASAARRLHDSLKNYGVVSRYYHSPWIRSNADDSYLKFKYSTSPPGIYRKVLDRFNGEYRFRKRFKSHLDHFLLNKPPGYEAFSYSRLPVKTPAKFNRGKPDVLHLHWIAQLFDYPSFFASCDNDLPIVWTLHDMNPLTGGCHYACDCRNFLEECGNCPQLNDHRSPSDLSHENWKTKWSAIKDKTIHVVADSYWLERQARESSLFSQAKSFRTIHYGIDTGLVHSRNQTICRAALQIPEDAFVLCYGASDVENPRKGLQELLLALTHLQNLRIVVLVFGAGGPLATNHLPNTDFRWLGQIGSPEILSILYSASDVFVIPSLHEAFGQTALEAMACGCAVVGYSTGGVPDLVRPGITGLLADTGNSLQLAEKLQWMMEHAEERNQMGSEGRRIAEQEFSTDLQARKYLDLYKSVTQ